MLTKDDLNQISKLMRREIQAEIQASEKRLEQRIVTKMTNMLDERFVIQTDQILEYVNAFNKSHGEWLKNHEVRIEKLEDHSFNLPK